MPPSTMREEPVTKLLASDKSHAIGACHVRAFASAFQECFGKGPMRWLRRQRIVCAAGWLEAGACSVAQAAERLDYEPEGAFRKAYRRELGNRAHVGPRVASQ
jgi:transcriptional regulator GlxA family with amidase domain